MNQKIKELLFYSGKQSCELAKYVGVSKSTISKWLNKGTLINPSYYQKIADFFGMTIAELTSGVEGYVAQTHYVPIKAQYANAVYSKRKTFEILENNVGYQTGDYIIFVPVDDNGIPCEFNHPIRDAVYEITYILNDIGLKDGYIAFSFREML